MDNIFIARQPIYDRNLAVVGYELLYRSGNMDVAVFNDADQASRDTILNSFLHIGIDNLVGSALAFINLPENFVINEALTPMFKEQSVLEILEDTEARPEVIDGIKRLKQEGYRIALDDFRHREKLDPFLELADFVKIDVSEKNEDEIQADIDYLQGRSLKAVATKVETAEIHNACLKMGFDYFQGFFFCRPQLVKQKYMPANKLVVLNVLSKLQDPELEIDDLEAVLAQDVTLSYKLLRYINSAAFSLRSEVESIKDAVVLLGLINIKHWISLILMSKVVANKPKELIVTALVRGKMCELLAKKYKPDIAPQMFIIGLFSVLDALMDTPMIELLDTVILSMPIKLALLDMEGEHGELYQQVLFYDQHQWDKIDSSKFEIGALAEAYLASVQWADESIKALSD